jgi:hypothetical protein
MCGRVGMTCRRLGLRLRLWFFALLVFALSGAPAKSQDASSAGKVMGAEPVPQPAVGAVLGLFDKYEVVGLPAAHQMQDVDDFIFSLIRDPRFSEKVSDIEFECGNSLYQPILDRYIAGEDVQFTEIQKVWRKMGQPMCGASAFVEQFFPLVRAVNQKLPPGRRLRVLAGDSPVDWDQIKSMDDIIRLVHRDASIASVMEREVLSKHRKALMLFGEMHLLHGVGTSAVSIYEKNYPGVTFIISDLGVYDTNLSKLAESKFVNWPIPAFAVAKGTRLGALDLSHFIPPPTRLDQDCNVHHEFPPEMQKPMEDFVDGFLYLGPQDLRIREKIPADIALDSDYRAELQKGGRLLGFRNAASETPLEFDQEIVKSAGDVIFSIGDQGPKADELKAAVEGCMERKRQSGTAQQNQLP